MSLETEITEVEENQNFPIDSLDEIQENDNTEPDITEDDIKEATAMGWSPKENWRGDPEKWVDAKTFNEKAYKSKEILRERLMKQDQTIQEMRKTFDEYKGFIQQKLGNIEKSAYQKAVNELEKREREAVELGDVQTFERIKKERMELDKNQLEVTPESEQKAQPSGDVVFQKWNQDNSWYNDDIDMTAWADKAAEIIKRKTGLVGEPLLHEVAKQVRDKFPEKFGNPRRSGGAQMSPSSRAGSGKQSGYESLPAEAKATCDRFVKQGLMTREEYVKFYSEQ